MRGKKETQAIKESAGQTRIRGGRAAKHWVNRTSAPAENRGGDSHMKLLSKLSAHASEVKQGAFVKPAFLPSHNFHGAAVFRLAIADRPRGM